jgi:hypothetical protein
VLWPNWKGSAAISWGVFIASLMEVGGDVVEGGADDVVPVRLLSKIGSYSA